MLLQDQYMRVIHLVRSNILRTLTSRKIAERVGAWTSHMRPRVQEAQAKRISFTREELEEGFRQTRQWEASTDEMFGGSRLTKIAYETMVEHPEVVLRQVTDHLGVPYAPPATALRRQNPEPLCDLITNYWDLRRSFAGSAWEAFFDESDGD